MDYCISIMIDTYPTHVQTANTKPKTKGIRIKEIRQFEKFFQVKWNPRAACRVVRDATNTFKQKKEACESLCWRAYEKAELKNLLFNLSHS